VGRPPRQLPVKRSASTASTVVHSPSVARHPSSVRRAASFRPEDISTPTFQSSTNSLLAEAPAASRMAEELSTPRPVRHPQRPEDERLQPTRVAPPPPAAHSSVSSLSSSSFEVLLRPIDKPATSSSDSTVEDPQRPTDQSTAASTCSSKPTYLPGASSLMSSTIEDPSSDDRSDCSGTGTLDEPEVRAPPRPRHVFNKVIRAESLRQQRFDHGSDVGPTPGAVNRDQIHHSAAASVVASLRDRFEARRAASELPDNSGTVSAPDTPVLAKPDIPPKPAVAAGKDEEQVGRRANRLQRQPAFREFDVVNASKLSTTELTRAT